MTLQTIVTDFMTLWRSLTNDGQLCWIGPEKGPVHQAAAGIVNAMWDLWAKQRGLLAVGETVLLLHPPRSPFSRCFNRDAKRGCQ